VITDGEQRKYHNFWTYSVEGLANTLPNGFSIPFSAGHVRLRRASIIILPSPSNPNG
jgi:hypothetical protein